ncbi:MAG: hypothetical protein A2452_04505 [Candidatus Firestonebacteria bacterium RIFOXYC2_FULL_39_67]|nr:MAG: hypothetical protein A2536_10620 [Candidatus Firestonebacteria bacterium RIFOXYD2_FULL_39_29]OGF57641.1 MAG: hypothetical protein A2452_04505 [Candidatus Firestonebacteria bacterium RIFOXYC2_FULL_39_67]
MLFIGREIENTCILRLKTNLILALIGPRQVGKTTLLNRIKDKAEELGLAEHGTDFYFSMDDAVIRAGIDKDFRYLEREISNALGRELKNEKRRVLIVIDEVQKSPEIFNWLKIVYDSYPKTIKIIVSGSSSLQLKKNSVESLAGRINFVKMFPLSLRELIAEETGKNLPEPLWLSLSEKNMESILRERQALLYAEKARLSGLLDRIMIEGTLPGIYTSTDKEEKAVKLRSLVNTYLEKDIRALGEVGSLEDYTNLLKTISYEVGSTFNLTSLSKDLGIALNTVKKYISILKDTFVLNALPPLLGSDRKKFVKNTKYYFYDIGVANSLAKRSEPEHIRAVAGFLFENLLLKSFEAENENRSTPGEKYFWRDYEEREIDFVLETKQGVKIPVEIYSGSSFPKEKTKNYRAFFEKFKEPPYGLFIYKGDFAVIKIAEKPIYMLPWWLWW